MVTKGFTSTYHKIINKYRLLVLDSTSSSSSSIIYFPGPIISNGDEINHNHARHTTNVQFRAVL
jgi:hypothetical protein